MLNYQSVTDLRRPCPFASYLLPCALLILPRQAESDTVFTTSDGSRDARRAKPAEPISSSAARGFPTTPSPTTPSPTTPAPIDDQSEYDEPNSGESQLPVLRSAVQSANDVLATADAANAAARLSGSIRLCNSP